MKNLSYLLIAILFLLLGCHFSTKYENRDSDRQDAERITSELFGHLQHLNFEKASNLFGEEFFKVTSKEELIKIFKITDLKLGKFKNGNLYKWDTLVSEGSINNGNYSLYYNVEFENGTADLKISLLKNKNNSLKIIGYTLKSNAFLE
ncbi:hypothetical protein [Mariniflexile sp.]|uniref:hypothetical protein n=1 Tax=Mariniflexile sp. TaxID=1979402 RepID=UPI004048BEFD